MFLIFNYYISIIQQLCLVGLVLASEVLELEAICYRRSAKRCAELDRNSDCVVFSPDGKLIADSQHKTVRIWDANSGEQLQNLQGHECSIYSVMFSADSKLLISDGGDATVRIWDVASGEQLQVLERDYYIKNVVFHLNKKIVSCGSDRQSQIQHIATEAKFQFPTEDYISSSKNISFSPDGKLLASGNRRGNISIWDIAYGKKLKLLSAEHNRSIYSVAFSPDSKLLASGGQGTPVRIWNVSSAKQICELQGHADVNSIAFSPDGSSIAFNDFTNIQVYSVISGEKIMKIKGSRYDGRNEGHREQVISLAFSPDGKFIASGSEDATARLWDVETGKQIKILTAHTSDVYVAFSPDGKWLATADGSIRLWDVESLVKK